MSIEKMNFKRWVHKVLPAVYDESLSYYELLCKVIAKLNEVINQSNDVAEGLEQLKNYVDTYFDNLDIQEEINNKLDEMAESGELAEIIGQFLNSGCVLKFGTIDEFKNSELVVNGSIAGVFGKDEVNDGFVNYYLVTSETTDIPLQNNLYAELIYNEKVDGSYLIDEIEHFEFYVENSKSTVQIFKIPNKDKFNKTIEMKHGFADDITSYTPASETTTHFSNRKNATLCINASIFDVNPDSANYNKILGLIIHNGEVACDTRNYYPAPDWYKNRYILGLKTNGLLQAYVGNLPAQDLLDDGVVESWQGFIPVLVNGQNNRANLLWQHNWEAPTYAITSDSTPVEGRIYYVQTEDGYKGYYGLEVFNPSLTYYVQTNTEGRYPRQIIAQNGTTKDLYVLSANGKGKTTNLGTTFEEVITLLKYVDSGITFAYALDEGGSTTTAYKNIDVINTTDAQTIYSSQTNGVGFIERKVPDFIYFAKSLKTQNDNNTNYILNKIEKLEEQIKALRLDQDTNNIVRTGSGLYIQNWDLNNLNNLAVGFSQLQNDGTIKNINSIVTNPTNGNISFYDIEHTNTVLRATPTGSILVNENSSGLAELANIFASVKSITDCNAITKTGIYFCRGNASNAPFHDSDTRANVIVNVRIAEDNSIAAQLGLMIGGNPTQIAYRCLIQGTVWTAWKYCTIA